MHVHLTSFNNWCQIKSKCCTDPTNKNLPHACSYDAFSAVESFKINIKFHVIDTKATSKRSSISYNK